MQKLIITDVQSIFYKIIDANIALEDKRYIDPVIATQIARKHKGRVVKVTKRLTETLEMEKV